MTFNLKSRDPHAGFALSKCSIDFMLLPGILGGIFTGRMFCMVVSLLFFNNMLLEKLVMWVN